MGENLGSQLHTSWNSRVEHWIMKFISKVHVFGFVAGSM
jgi:hypothetical protein